MIFYYNITNQINNYMKKYHRSEMQEAFVNWENKALDWNTALSLNFKAYIKQEIAIKAAMQFWQRIDCKVYGPSKVQRGEMRLPRMCFLEGNGKFRNYHYHIALEVPKEYNTQEFREYLKNIWEQFDEAGRFTHVEARYGDLEWLYYICKEVKGNTDVLCLKTSTVTP